MKKVYQIKDKVFFYFNVTPNLSSGETDFLIVVSWNIRLGPSKTSSLSYVALYILKYLKSFMVMLSGLRRGSSIFLYVTFYSLLDVPKTSFFSLSFALEATKQTQVLYPWSPWRNWISVRRTSHVYGLAFKIVSFLNPCYSCSSN
jgi:hypothetical protein